MGIAIQDCAIAAVEELKQKYRDGKTDENTKIGFNLVIMQFLECCFPCTMVAPLLPYLKKLPGLVGLEINDVGGSGLTTAEGQQRGYAFTDEDAPTLLEILKTNPHLFHVKININGMTKGVENQFVQEWQAIIATRQRPSAIQEFLALEAPGIASCDASGGLPSNPPATTETSETIIDDTP
jgi:hypothetical protein